MTPLPIDRRDEIRSRRLTSGEGTIQVRAKPEMLGFYLKHMIPRLMPPLGTWSIDFTALTFPGHDPPVAWKVADHPLAGIGIDVIAAPGMPPQGFSLTGSPRYMDPQPVILDGEPGRAAP